MHGELNQKLLTSKRSLNAAKTITPEDGVRQDVQTARAYDTQLYRQADELLMR
jgi:hypothetical protein